MKSLINLLKIRKFTGIIILLIFTQSCCSYYKVAKAPDVAVTPAEIVQANPQRYFILRAGTSAYCMNNVVLSQDKKTLTCTLDSLPDEHKLHLKNGINGKMRYKRTRAEAPILNEVHLFVTPDPFAVAGARYTLVLEKVQKVEFLEKDKGRTTKSYILGGVVVTTLVAVVVISIAALLYTPPKVDLSSIRIEL
ncbi:MAG TPA: hypothetical protein VGN20_04140 [Mucilaginibacter sp.]|jgi:hypothetical protein